MYFQKLSFHISCECHHLLNFCFLLSNTAHMSNASVVLPGGLSLPPPHLNSLSALEFRQGLSVHLCWPSASPDQLSACQHEPFCALRMLSLKINQLFRLVSHKISTSISLNKPKSVQRFVAVILLFFFLLIFLRISNCPVSYLL